MLKSLQVRGFRTLSGTSVQFTPLTLMIGKNGVGKTTILDVVQTIGKYARGGPERAFGPPPWSLSWQRTKGMGHVSTVDFELQIEIDHEAFDYILRLNESNQKLIIEEERLTRFTDNTPVASRPHKSRSSDSILDPQSGNDRAKEVGAFLAEFESYELNPSAIERGNDPKHDYVGREGYGVSGFLAHMKDQEPDRFESLQQRFQTFRPETEAIKIRSTGSDLFWALQDKGIEFDFPSVHISWGDRQLLGLLCVLYAAKPGSTLALEEIDRGFHHSRYQQVVDLLTEVAYEGIDGAAPIQVIATTHSPAFVNKLEDRTDEMRIVSRTPPGGTLVRNFSEAVKDRLGSESPDRPFGELWEMGIFDDDTLSRAPE